MDLYTTSLILGGGGLAVMGIAGMTHTHADSGAHTLSGHSVGHGHHHIGGATHAHRAQHSAHAHHAIVGHAHGVRASLGRGLLAAISLKILFSVLLGIGVTGLA